MFSYIFTHCELFYSKVSKCMLTASAMMLLFSNLPEPENLGYIDSGWGRNIYSGILGIKQILAFMKQKKAISVDPNSILAYFLHNSCQGNATRKALPSQVHGFPGTTIAQIDN